MRLKKKSYVLAIQVASSRHNPGPLPWKAAFAQQGNQVQSPPAPAPEGFPRSRPSFPSPWAQYARRQSGSSRTASPPRFLGQRFPANQSAGYRPAIGWRRQAVWTFRLHLKFGAESHPVVSAAPRGSAGLERGQTRARNRRPAPPPRAPSPLRGISAPPPRPPAKRGRETACCLPDPSPRCQSGPALRPSAPR